MAARNAAGRLTEIPRGRYIGKPTDGIPTTEAEHHIQWPACGGWLDCRDLAQVLAHDGRCRTRQRTNHNEDCRALLPLAPDCIERQRRAHTSQHIQVIDGDTISTRGQTIRAVHIAVDYVTIR